MMQRFPRIKAGGDNSATPFFAPPVLAFHTTGTAAFGYCELTGEVHEEVEIHNHALDLMGHDIDTSSGVLSGTVDRSKMVFERKLNRRMITLVISFLVFYSYIT
ncbi:SNARE domain [Musa troglodytarum]|uniref:SNARE domain n=1 Tax=Musa troglodytarum TaxID=320322 RepID=A0A9E7FWB4_9LILI|nr:SNARE domain [Musa troglodytarum]